MSGNSQSSNLKSQIEYLYNLYIDKILNLNKIW